MRQLIILAFWLSIGAGCHKDVDPDCVEKPRDNKPCYTVYIPVCGCNGKTYSNNCEAEAYGITKYTSGECGK